MSVVPTTNFIDNSGGVGTVTPNGLSLPQDISAIFIPYTGNYKFTNSYSGLLNATGFKYNSNGTFVDISNLFDISTNTASYTGAPFLLGYKIPYGSGGTLTDIGQIFGLVKPLPPSWTGFYQSPYTKNYQISGVALSSSGQYVLAVTSTGIILNNSNYGYGPSDSWSSYTPTLLDSSGNIITTDALWSSCAISSSGQYQAVFISAFPNGGQTQVSNQGNSYVYYSSNYGSSWIALYSCSTNELTNTETLFQSCAFYQLAFSGDGNVLSLASTVTADDTSEGPDNEASCVIYTYNDLLKHTYRFIYTTGSNAGPTNGSAPRNGYAILSGQGYYLSEDLAFFITMNYTGQYIFVAGYYDGQMNQSSTPISYSNDHGITFYADSYAARVGIPFGLQGLYCRNNADYTGNINRLYYCAPSNQYANIQYVDDTIINTTNPPSNTYSNPVNIYTTAFYEFTPDSLASSSDSNYIYAVLSNSNQLGCWSKNNEIAVTLPYNVYQLSYNVGSFPPGAGGYSVSCSSSGSYVAVATTNGVLVNSHYGGLFS